MMLSHSLICMALYKCMKHVSQLFCSWDAQVQIKSPMIIVRATALPSSWAKKDWTVGNTENNTEYTNWQQVPCCHTYVFSVFSHDVFPFNFSNLTWTANKLYITFHSQWHSCLFWIILIYSTRLSTPRMCIVCFIAGEWLSSYVRRENNCLTFVFCW